MGKREWAECQAAERERSSQTRETGLKSPLQDTGSYLPLRVHRILKKAGRGDFGGARESHGREGTSEGGKKIPFGRNWFLCKKVI